MDNLNSLYIPELREMLAENNIGELREFCDALNPGRVADFMEFLSPGETWGVLRHAERNEQVEIFQFLQREKQLAIIEQEDRREIAQLIAHLPPDDRVDLLNDVNPEVVNQLLPLIPVHERRDILRLSAYPEGTAGAVMTTDVAKLSENLTVTEALDELRRQAQELETIYYLYVVDDDDHLRGIVSGRQLISAMSKPLKLRDLMETDVVTVDVDDDQEEVAQKVERYNFLAIPVVNDEHRLLGIITHDDVMDVVREEATEDAHRIAGVAPLEEGYLQTRLFTLGWKRGIWLTILFVGALLTTFSLRRYAPYLDERIWLVMFLPMIVSCGGNSGNQSATLVITALTIGDIKLSDWRRIVLREILMGLMLGGFLALIGLLLVLVVTQREYVLLAVQVVPPTLVLVVLCGTLVGSVLPLLFKRLGLDPALMSNPFVAGVIDILGIVIYVNVAMIFLPPVK